MPRLCAVTPQKFCYNVVGLLDPSLISACKDSAKHCYAHIHSRTKSKRGTSGIHLCSTTPGHRQVRARDLLRPRHLRRLHLLVGLGPAGGAALQQVHRRGHQGVACGHTTPTHGDHRRGQRHQQLWVVVFVVWYFTLVESYSGFWLWMCAMCGPGMGTGNTLLFLSVFKHQCTAAIRSLMNCVVTWLAMHSFVFVFLSCTCPTLLSKLKAKLKCF